MLDELPLYFSWEPFVLTITVYLSAFILISIFSVYFTPDKNLIDLFKGYSEFNGHQDYSMRRAIIGIVFIVTGYILALLTSRMTMYSFGIAIIILITIGTYLFFSDTTHFILDKIRNRKHVYWKKYRMLSVAEQSMIMKSNSKMFFVVTMVTALAFLMCWITCNAIILHIPI